MDFLFLFTPSYLVTVRRQRRVYFLVKVAHAPWCAYGEFRLLCRCKIHQRINQVSRPRTTAQITAPPRRLTRIAVTKAEMQNTMAIKDPKAAPMRARDPRSCLTLSTITTDVSSCPPTDHQLAPMPAIYMVNGQVGQITGEV